MPSAPAPAPKTALAFMFVTVLMSMVGFGIIMPILPELMMEVTGENISNAALYGTGLYFVYALAQFFMSPILGGLSDRYGRRPVLLLSLVFYALDFLLLALAPTYAWLVIARLLSGATSATYATANAVIADISPPEKRSSNFGLIGAAFGLGFIVGPLVGGYFSTLDIRAPFYAAAVLGAANFCFGFFFFPETMRNPRPFELRRANPFGSLWSVSRYRIVLVVLCAYFLMQFAHNALPAIFSYFATFSYGWGAVEISLALAFVGLTAAVVQGGLTRVLIPKLGEPKAVLLGASAMVVSFVGYTFFAPTGAHLYLWVAVGALGGLMMPAMQGIMSAAVPADGQGELQGAVASVMSLTMMTSPPIMGAIFAAFTDDEGVVLAGAPLLLSALCILLSMLPFAVIVSRGVGRKAQASPGVSA